MSTPRSRFERALALLDGSSSDQSDGEQASARQMTPPSRSQKAGSEALYPDRSPLKEYLRRRGNDLDTLQGAAPQLSGSSPPEHEITLARRTQEGNQCADDEIRRKASDETIRPTSPPAAPSELSHSRFGVIHDDVFRSSTLLDTPHTPRRSLSTAIFANTPQRKSSQRSPALAAPSSAAGQHGHRQTSATMRFALEHSEDGVSVSRSNIAAEGAARAPSPQRTPQRSRQSTAASASSVSTATTLYSGNRSVLDTEIDSPDDLDAVFPAMRPLPSSPIPATLTRARPISVTSISGEVSSGESRQSGTSRAGPGLAEHTTGLVEYLPLELQTVRGIDVNEIRRLVAGVMRSALPRVALEEVADTVVVEPGRASNSAEESVVSNKAEVLARLENIQAEVQALRRRTHVIEEVIASPERPPRSEVDAEGIPDHVKHFVREMHALACGVEGDRANATEAEIFSAHNLNSMLAEVRKWALTVRGGY